MKKNRFITVITTIVLSAAMLSGCKGDENVHSDPSQITTTPSAGAVDPVATGDELTIFDYDMTQFVEVGDYLHLTEYVESEISDAQFQYYYVNFLSSYANMVDPSLYVTDRAVRDGDIISLDYCGKKDGVAFDGGTAEGYLLDIGSGTFIPGFEEGLIDVMPGEEVDLDLTFPDNYGNSDLAGQAVVFTCTVNGIVPIDAIVETANNNREEGDPEILTEDDLVQFVRTEIAKQSAEQDKSNLKQEILETIHTVVTEKQAIPAELISSYDEHTLKELNYMAQNYYQTDAENMMAYFGMTVDGYLAEYSKPQLLADAAYYCIAVENNLLQTEEEFNAEIEEYLATSGLTREEFFETESEEWYKVLFLRDIVVEYICDQIMQQ